jgi:predicted house-cleaning noncanonical NTP pyrophosphatase (MazG superfamily)
MRKIYYNKLIRDKIPEIIESNGSKYEVREIEDVEEYQQQLLKKVREEAAGVSRSRDREHFFEELADLIVVIDALKAAYNVDEAELREAIESNRVRKGGFDKKLFLHYATDEDGYKSDETPQGISDK